MGQVTEVTHVTPAVSNQTALTPMAMIGQALQSGASVEMIASLMDLQDRYETKQARKAFDNAMASAKAEIPVIIKNRTVDFTSAKGRTHYRHEDLAEVSRTVSPILAKHGLSYRFRTTSNPDEPVVVTCIVSHRDGHCEENTLSAGRDESGSKNSIQSIGSTLTYLQRMTLKAALGLAASEDDDGKTSGGAHAAISQDQVGSLVELLESTNADKARFLKYFKVETLADLPAKRFAEAVQMLNAKGSR